MEDQTEEKKFNPNSEMNESQGFELEFPDDEEDSEMKMETIDEDYLIDTTGQIATETEFESNKGLKPSMSMSFAKQ